MDKFQIAINRKTGLGTKNGDRPSWFSRAMELRNSDLTWNQVAEVLNSEGFAGSQGVRISADTIRNRLCYEKRSGYQGSRLNGFRNINLMENI